MQNSYDEKIWIDDRLLLPYGKRLLRKSYRTVRGKYAFRVYSVNSLFTPFLYKVRSLIPPYKILPGNFYGKNMTPIPWSIGLQSHILKVDQSQRAFLLKFTFQRHPSLITGWCPTLPKFWFFVLCYFFCRGTQIICCLEKGQRALHHLMLCHTVMMPRLMPDECLVRVLMLIQNECNSLSMG